MEEGFSIARNWELVEELCPVCTGSHFGQWADLAIRIAKSPGSTVGWENHLGGGLLGHWWVQSSSTFWRKREYQGSSFSYGKDKRAAHVSASYRKGFGMQHMTFSAKIAGAQKPGVCTRSHCCGSGACTAILPVLPSTPLPFPSHVLSSPHLTSSLPPPLSFSLLLFQSLMYSRLAKTHCIAKNNLELFTLLLLRHPLACASWVLHDSMHVHASFDRGSFLSLMRTWRFLIHAASFCVAWYLTCEKKHSLLNILEESRGCGSSPRSISTHWPPLQRWIRVS